MFHRVSNDIRSDKDVSRWPMAHYGTVSMCIDAIFQYSSYSIAQLLASWLDKIGPYAYNPREWLRVH